MKKENIQSPSKASQRDEDRWVDVHNDTLMVELGIRPAMLSPRDKTVWTKTPNERRLLKSLRRSGKGRIHFHSVPEKSIPVRTKLIIQLVKNDKFPKTTYSTECWQHEIKNSLQLSTLLKISPKPSIFIFLYKFIIFHISNKIFLKFAFFIFNDVFSI